MTPTTLDHPQATLYYWFHQSPRRLSTMRTAGALSFHQKSLTVPSPYLSLDDRLAYLRSHGYVHGNDEISARSRSFLADVNFHYYLGYARNYRTLVRKGLAEFHGAADRIIDIIELDHQLAEHTYTAVRIFEWRLRAHFVIEHCRHHPPTECFLSPGHFTSRSTGGKPTSARVREEILRSREPYILEQFAAHARTCGAPWQGSPSLLDKAQQSEVLKSLPIWAVVDSWSLGLLTDVIMETRPGKQQPETPPWKSVAQAFGISNQVLDTQLRSLIVLRNMIAHHSRLWMRPATRAPKKPKIYRRRARNVQDRSLYTVLLALASFLRSDSRDTVFLDKVDRLLESNKIFAQGIRSPLTTSEPPR
ncbi:Abi family protein [Actinomyces wuliandei]|uniref:Abi family protein n=2 Tax=Actinomyces wuliandei TaxID=2057743 RepID=UPI0015D62BCF|nr:Abi family protein [Actinomyces wuliandei]